MKRSLLLLIAVVLAAVMLSGCVMWPFGIAVTYELQEDVFAAHNNPKRVKKESAFDVEFLFDEEYTGERTVEAFEITVDDGTEDGAELVESTLITGEGEAAESLGIKLEIVSVKKPIKVSILFPEAEVDPEP